MKKDSLQEFVGRQVEVTEEVRELDLRALKTKSKFTEYKLSESDAAIAELRAQVGDRLRVWLPNTMGTMDHDLTRCNARVEKGDDGVFRITKVYFG